MFSEEGVRLITKDPAVGRFPDDRIFSAMIEDIADNPGNIIKYEKDSRLQPALVTILPLMLSIGPDREPPAPDVPPPPITPSVEWDKEPGNECFRRQNFQGDLECYDQAIAIDGNQMVYRSNWATALTKLKRFQKAMDAALKAVEVGQAAGAPSDQVAKLSAKKATAALGCGKDGGGEHSPLCTNRCIDTMTRLSDNRMRSLRKSANRRNCEKNI
jgi:stress-induced-phosphoprotein 1